MKIEFEFDVTKTKAFATRKHPRKMAKEAVKECLDEIIKSLQEIRKELDED